MRSRLSKTAGGFVHLFSGFRPLIAPAAVLLAASGAAASPDAVVRTIAVSGQPAPGLAGVTFADVGAARLTGGAGGGGAGDGDAVFFASLAGTGVTGGSGSSLWWRGFGAPAAGLLAREGGASPFEPAGETLGGLAWPSIAGVSGEQVVTPASLISSATGLTTLGFFSIDAAGGGGGGGAGGAMGLAREGVPAPGLNPSADFARFSSIAVAGEFGAFVANRLTGGLFGTSSNGGGVWQARQPAGGPTVTVTLLAAGGQPAPGFAPAAGAVISYLDSPAVNASGDAVFRASVAGAGLTSETNSALYLGRVQAGGAASLTALIVAGQATAGLPAGVTLRDLAADPAITASGQGIVLGRLSGGGVTNQNDLAILAVEAASGGPVATVVAREGMTIGPAVLLGEMATPLSVNASGLVAFRTQLTGPGVAVGAGVGSATGIVVAGGDEPARLVARRGAQAPRLPAGVQFDLLGDPVVSDSGLVAFVSRLRGPSVTVANAGVLYAASAGRSTGLVPLVRTGEAIEIAAGDVRTVASIGFEGLRDSVANETVLARLTFVDRSTAVVALRIGCLVDFDGDRVATPDDLTDFIAAYFAQTANPVNGPRTDFDGSGVIDPDDLSSYITAYFGEGCG